MRRVFSEAQLDVLEEKVYRLLGEVGMKVESDEITEALLKRGCRLGPDGRVRFPREYLREVVRAQEAKREKASEGWEPPQLRGMMPCAFSPGPTRFYDYAQRRIVPADTPIFTEMAKLAEVVPEIQKFNPWFRQDVPPEVEPIETVVLGLKLTKKTIGIDAILPGQVKYLVEIGEIVTGRPGDDSFLLGSQCITPPLILGWRSAGEIVERVRRGVKKFFVASMVMMGVSTPVTLPGAVVVSASEILGGWACIYALDPEARMTGGAVNTLMDMRSGECTMSAPEVALLDEGVAQLFEAKFGGHVGASQGYAPCVKAPGLQAVYENFFCALAHAWIRGGPPIYPGKGTLDSGGVGSPEQLMLDLEVLKSLSHVKPCEEVDDETLPFELIKERVLSGESFLDADHTLRHFRELWSPSLFLRHGDRSEEAILERAHKKWKELLQQYRPPEWPEEVLRALDDVVRRAREELLG